MGKDTKKKCLSCGAPSLFAIVTLVKAMPLADRNGTVKVGGFKIGQLDLKLAWDTIGGIEQSPEQRIRGPIVCEACEAEHFFVLGAKDPLRLGSVTEARRLGYDGLLEK